MSSEKLPAQIHSSANMEPVAGPLSITHWVFEFQEGRVFRIIFLAALLFYAGFLALRMGAVAGAADSSGYINAASEILSGEFHPLQRTIDGLPAADLPSHAYVPLGFSPDQSDSARINPTYPMGLPLLIAAASFVCGLNAAPSAVLLVSSLALAVATYKIGRTCGLVRCSSFFVAFSLACSPQVLMMSIQTMSDIPAGAAVSLALLWGMQAEKHDRAAFGAGLAFGLAVLIRPTSVLLAPVMLLLCYSSFRALLWIGIGALPGFATNLIFNRMLYGNPLSSGYGAMGDFFSASNLLPSAVNYIKWGWVCFTPLACLAIFAPLWPGVRHVRAMMALWIWCVMLGVFYASYSYTQQAWWYHRFLIPIGPALVVLGMITLRQFWSKLPFALRDWHVMLSFIVMLLWSCWWTSELYATNLGKDERMYKQASEWVNSNLPRNAVIVCKQCSGSLYYYCPQVIVRWDSMQEGVFSKVREAAIKNGLPIYAVMYKEEYRQLKNPEIRGPWHRIDSVRHVTIWRLEDQH
ncbi:MAG: hypothetical protein WC378_13210 [Opitutaceae bacterium]|jgi:hypothetical protein